MRARIEKECYKIVEEKTAQWENNLHCVTFEKDEKGKALKEVSQELDGTRVQLQRIQQQLHNAESEASTLRKDKTALESKFKQAQRTILESSIASSDLAALTEQLEEKDEILKTKEKEFNTMRQDYDDLQGQITALHESVKRFEAQISEHKSTIESERQKSIAQLSESRKKEETAVQEAHNQITELKREKQDVELCWHRSRSSENLLRDMQSRTSCELEGLRAELVKVSNAKEATEEDIRRIREAADEELKTLEAEHRKETRDFQHRLTQAEAVLKESKAKIKHLMDEKDQFFETHKKVAEQRVRPKLANDDKQTFCLEELLDVESHQQTPISRNAPAMTLNNTLFDSRRQFNRQTSSVAGTEQLSHTRTRVTAGGVKSGSIVNREVELAHPFEGVDASMAIDLGTQERLGPDGVSILEPVPEPVPETQVQVPTLSFKDNNQISVRTEQNRGGSTSSLSDPRSDLFDDLFHTRASTPTGSQHLNGSRAPTKLSIQATSYQTPRRPVKTSMHDSRSFDRPKSQANTASRMKPPPPPNQVDYLDQDRQEPAFDAAPMRSQHNSSHRDNKASNHVPSSPEFLHRTPSTAKMTYGHHAGRPITFGAIRRDSVSRGLDQSSSQKRKSPAKHAGSDTPAKRHRQLSQSIPPSSLPSTLPRDHEGRARGYPGVTQRSQGLKRTSRKKSKLQSL
jgi:predicted  nucleic acid-binding Zn-ribbon protein